jgi:hypothetical protein
MSETIHDLVRVYFEAWNEQDGERRDAMLAALFAENAEIVDPDWTAVGLDEIVAAIGEAREKLGELALGLSTVISSHHDTALFSWTLTRPDTDAAPLATGYGTVVVSNGLIQRAYNFFG